jgi:hypothetical protein
MLQEYQILSNIPVALHGKPAPADDPPRPPLPQSVSLRQERTMCMVQQDNSRDCGICVIVSIRRLSAAIADASHTALSTTDPTVVAAVVSSAGLHRPVPPGARGHVALCLLQTHMELSVSDPW